MNNQQRKLIEKEIEKMSTVKEEVEGLLEALPVEEDEAAVAAALVILKGKVAELADHALALDNAQGFFETMRDDEEEKFDNMPEGLQEGEAGQKLQSSQEYLENANDAAEDARDSLQEAVDALEEDFNEDSEKLDTIKTALTTAGEFIDAAIDGANDATD